MQRPVFSVATPTRNALDKLRRCIGSVRGQKEVSVEHLVQDGCSVDGSAAWLQQQAAKDNSLHFTSCADGGMYDAINRAWSRCTGQYLSWLNADEQYLPGTLARVQQFFESHPAVDAIFADYLVVDASGQAVALRKEVPLRRFYVANGFLNAQSCTMFFRRRLWDAGILKFDPKWRYAADKDMVLTMLAQGVRFEHLPQVLSIFGIDGNNLSTHSGMQQEAEAVRLAHGAFRFKPLRALPLIARRAERLLRGGYGTQSIDYMFALDEMPLYARYRAPRLGGRYSLADIHGSATRLDSSDQAR